MPTHRRYTAKQKAEAIGIAAVQGVTAAGEMTGIPKTTIQYWKETPDFVQLRTRVNEEVVGDLWVGVQIGAKALVEGFTSGAPLRDKAAAFTALAERYALLSGGATARTEHRDVADPIVEDSAMAAARQGYLTVLSGPTAVGSRNGHGAAPDGTEALSAVPLSSPSANGHQPSKAGPEGSSNGHQSDDRDRGTLAG